MVDLKTQVPRIARACFTSAKRMRGQVADWSRKSGWLRPSTIGERGERAATRYLKRSGLRIVTTGFRNRMGEIDIIALDEKHTVVFAEVKTRRNHSAGHPVEAVDERKQRQVARLALAFCKQHDLSNLKARFDIVAVTWPDTSKSPLIEHFENAFALQSVGTV